MSQCRIRVLLNDRSRVDDSRTADITDDRHLSHRGDLVIRVLRIGRLVDRLLRVLDRRHDGRTCVELEGCGVAGDIGRDERVLTEDDAVGTCDEIVEVRPCIVDARELARAERSEVHAAQSVMGLQVGLEVASDTGNRRVLDVDDGASQVQLEGRGCGHVVSGQVPAGDLELVLAALIEAGQRGVVRDGVGSLELGTRHLAPDSSAVLLLDLRVDEVREGLLLRDVEHGVVARPLDGGNM